MALYTAESIERVKEAVDMVQLVSARTDLRRVGARHVGLCPFHDERTPSFSVNAERRLYHCFGCGESGDALRFVQQTEGTDFRGAVEMLAERYGVELRREREDPRAEERRRRRERLLELLERTARFYATYLSEAAEAASARAYLERRGLSEPVLRDFRVGYSPSAWDRVTVGAQRDGFRLEELAAVGLAQRGRQGSLYDRFRGRIMFPLADARGRVLGFGARALKDTQGPKYLNTAESELYHKGRQLFGIDRARADAAKRGRVVVVEGYTDVLALHQVGLSESVAIMGTAVTQEQLAELTRAAPRILLALDADRSGQDAMLRAARAAATKDAALLVVDMPEGTDPAELVAAEGPEAFARRLERAMSVPEFEVRRVLADGDMDTPSGRDRALEQVSPLIAALPARSASRDHLVRYVADRLDVPVEYVTTHLRTPPGRPGSTTPSPREGDAVAEARPVSAEALVRAERAFLATCLAQSGLGREYLDRLSDEHLSSPLMRRAREHLVRHPEDPLTALPADDPPLAALVTELAMLADEQPSSGSVLEMGFLQLELRRIERGLRHATQHGDLSRQDELAAARQDVRRRMDEVMGRAA